MGLITNIFGTHSERELKKIDPLIDKIEALGPEYHDLTDEQLKEKTPQFKARLANGETLDDILPEAFATVREAADRVLGLRPYRVQLVGGVILHQGRIAEMKTGEGKTLVATLPAYLNALAGKGVHIVTVNDYLATRDSEWMGKVYRFLGLKVGLIVHDLTGDQRREAYAADITYGTNNELGFDYLRDNMALEKKQMVQRGHNFAIVDEVDSILIDEARTPLIISGQGDESTELYQQADAFVRTLKKAVFASTDEKEEESDDIDADYVVDEKARTASLTLRGIAKAEKAFTLENLADLENATLAHHINQAVKAHGVMKRDVDYVVKDGEVIIVDEFTGRLMFGRRYNEGLHQAIEAKEGVKVANENKTLATITFQNFFRLYDKLSGMTGTAMTEQEEFNTIYGLDVIEIPTNKDMIRIDHPDVIYKNDTGKYHAIIKQIQDCHEKGQPVLVGTASVEKSEYLSSLLKKEGIRHNVLNAKNHEKEAEIIAQAGKFGAVTISTNMAGRGTDIMLGGNAEYMAKNDLRKAEIPEEIISEATGFADTDDEEILKARQMFTESMKKHKVEVEADAEKVRDAGGLFILGTERHDARRVDNQLRGRSGRQGDPGESRFYIAMTDDVMRLFGSERIMGMMDSLGIPDDMPIDKKTISNAIENAQKNIESRNFQSRKNVLEYDDVMNTQRNLIYEQRMQVLNGENLKETIQTMIRDVITQNVNSAVGNGSVIKTKEQLDEALDSLHDSFLVKGKQIVSESELGTITADQLIDRLYDEALSVYDAREKELSVINPDTGNPLIRDVERFIMLKVVDEYWMDHIDAMEDLKDGIGLRAYAQVNPVDEYKQEGFDMFEAMINGIKHEVVRRLFTAHVRQNAQLERKNAKRRVLTPGAGVGGDDSVKKQPVRVGKKPGRNDPCPCGSGKKYKKCCGRFDN